VTAPWAMGRDKIAELLGKRHLEQISGAAANGEFLVKQARTRAWRARAAKEADPAGAFALAYDGMRQAVTALLVQQGLRHGPRVATSRSSRRRRHSSGSRSRR
jgi:hypothetical protein